MFKKNLKGKVKMKILVINAGSSSLKFQLIDMETETAIAKGNCERVTIDGSFLNYKANGKKLLLKRRCQITKLQ